MTFALPGAARDAAYAFAPPTCDAHVDQEIFEVLGHTLYESVHVFLEHRDVGEDVGPSAFLYPFLMGAQQETEGIVADVAASIREKAEDSCRLREQVAERQAESIAAATRAIAERLDAGGRLLIFGNGGSSTDANDFALDCMDPAAPAVRAISLASEPAILSAVANDVGTELMFLRQIVARARPNDVAFALSTSGGSKNVVAALEEARKRGMLVVALLGYDGGEIVRRSLADHAIVVDAEYIPRIQEVQGAVYHAMREFFV
jgi:D-sedoheptulose 7-phosphate isomerase